MTAVVRTLRIAELLAEADQQRVDPGRIDVGQLGQVADAHHHRGVGIAPADLEIAAERRREAEADRLEDRVDPERHAPAVEELDRRVQPVERARPVGDGDDLDAPVGGPVAVGRVDAQDQLGPGRDGRGDLGRVEAVDRDADALGRAGPRPRRRRRPRGRPGRSPGRSRRPPRRANRSASARISSRASCGAWLISARISMSKAP